MTAVAHTQPGFFAAVGRALRHYSDFAGRATRAEFWWYALFTALAFSLCGVFNFVALAPGVTFGSVLAALFALGTLVPSLAVGVRRLRDAGQAWGHMLWLLVPIGGLVILAVYWTRPSQPDAFEDVEHRPR
jgi:uncharacterized membrane protein YhaH (DUF805 family)